MSFQGVLRHIERARIKKDDSNKTSIYSVVKQTGDEVEGE